MLYCVVLCGVALCWMGWDGVEWCGGWWVVGDGWCGGVVVRWCGGVWCVVWCDSCEELPGVVYGSASLLRLSCNLCSSSACTRNLRQ